MPTTFGWDGNWDNLADPAFRTYYTYDSLGQVASITYPTLGPQGATSSSTYLSLSRVRGLVKSIASNRGASPVTNALYSDSRWLKEWDAPSGVRTLSVSDDPVRSRIREMKVLNSAGGTLWTTGAYGYDGAGQIASIGTDIFTYDALGRLKGAKVSGTTAGTLYRQTFFYDPFGNTTSTSKVVDPGSTTTSTTYNVSSLTNRVLGIGVATNWEYWPDGALRHDDSFDYVYDNARRLLQIQAGGVEIGEYLYDSSGLRVQRKENHGKEVFYFRDPDGNVLSQFSRPVGTTLTPQWDRDFAYLVRTRVSMIEKPLPSAVSWKITKSVGNVISLEWYGNPELDIYGYLVYRKGPGEASFTPLYAGSLVISTAGLTYLDTSGLVPGNAYTYKIVAVDSAGNQGAPSAERLITFQDTVAPGPPTGLTASAGDGSVTLSWSQPSSPPADLAGYYVYRRTGPSYDTPVNAVPLTDGNYNDLGVANGTTYYYIVRSVDTAGLPSSDSNEVSATPQAPDGGGGGGGGGDGPPVVTSFDPGPDQAATMLWARLVNPSSTERLQEWRNMAGNAPYSITGQAVTVKMLFLHSDHLGSLRLVTDRSGFVVSNHKYLPFGEEVQPARTLDPYRYAGYERDSESGMDYVNARFYGSSMGRWLTPDPLGDGYGYAANTPVNASDPSGLWWVAWPSEASGITWFWPGWIGSNAGSGGSTPSGWEDCPPGIPGPCWRERVPGTPDDDFIGSSHWFTRQLLWRLAMNMRIAERSGPGGNRGQNDGEKKSVKEIVKKLICAPAAWQFSAAGPKFGPLAISISYIPSTGRLIVAGGVGLVFPLAGWSAGPLFGPSGKEAADILEGPGWGGDIAVGPVGYQESRNDAGVLRGYAVGSGQVSVMYVGGLGGDVGTICQ